MLWQLRFAAKAERKLSQPIAETTGTFPGYVGLNAVGIPHRTRNLSFQPDHSRLGSPVPYLRAVASSSRISWLFISRAIFPCMYRIEIS